MTLTSDDVGHFHSYVLNMSYFFIYLPSSKGKNVCLRQSFFYHELPCEDSLFDALDFSRKIKALSSLGSNMQYKYIIIYSKFYIQNNIHIY